MILPACAAFAELHARVPADDPRLDHLAALLIDEVEKEIEEEEMSPELMEQLADREHDSWARWMDYLFSKSTKNDDGSVTIPADLVKRWQRQVETPYADLSEREKESDRSEVRQIEPLILAAFGPRA